MSAEFWLGVFVGACLFGAAILVIAVRRDRKKSQEMRELQQRVNDFFDDDIIIQPDNQSTVQRIMRSIDYDD